jgi:hypothetical protein
LFQADSMITTCLALRQRSFRLRPNGPLHPHKPSFEIAPADMLSRG